MAVRLPRQRFKQCAVVRWTVFQQEQLVPERAVFLVQCCHRLMQTRCGSSNFPSDFFFFPPEVTENLSEVICLSKIFPSSSGVEIVLF